MRKDIAIHVLLSLPVYVTIYMIIFPVMTGTDLPWAWKQPLDTGLSVLIGGVIVELIKRWIRRGKTGVH